MEHSVPIKFRAEDVLAAVHLLSKIETKDLKINPVFAKKLYSDTGLERGKPEGKHDVIRKNVYYLARHMKNVVGFVIQFTQRGIFSLDEKDDILDQEKELCVAVAFFSLLIRQEPGTYPRALEFLRAFENAQIANFLESSAAQLNAVGTEPVVRRTPTRPPQPQRAPRLFPAWVCAHCTYENPPGTDKICTVCFRTKGSPSLEETLGTSTESLEDVRPCNACTLENSMELDFCVACGSPLNEDVFVPALPDIAIPGLPDDFD